MTCSRRLFLLGTATTFAGAFLAACGEPPSEEVAKTAVPVGSAVILDRFIIAQPNPGEYVAYSAVCPHQQQKITGVEDENGRCTAHGSVFNTASGEVVSGPSLNPLTTAALEETGDQLIVSNPES